MKRNMLQFNFRVLGVRALFLFFALFTSIQMFGAGWTPTDAGLVVNLKQGDRFLLSVWVDKNGNGTEEPGEEFFVSNYTRYTGGYYGYGSGTYMKLLAAPNITEMNEWSVGAPLNRNNNNLGAFANTVYTIWNDSKMLKTSGDFKFLGELTDNYNDSKGCDVVFVIPTNRGVPTVDGRAGLSSFDPNGTLDRGTAPFDGATGTGFLGMTYREVYMFYIPKANNPISYTNAGLVTFNTTLSTWKLSSGAGDIAKGKAAYAFADQKHDPTPRTIFRLYLLDDPINSCSSFFFATDEQSVMRYRKTNNAAGTTPDSTAAKKIYTMDRQSCMHRLGETQYYETDLMQVPVPDSTYYYVGYNNDYYAKVNESSPKMSTPGAYSQFTKIRQLPIFGLSSSFKAPAGVYGRMVADATSTVDNLNVSFEPAGYFLEVSTGKKVAMRKTGEHEWTTEEMWTITDAYYALSLKVMLCTKPEFSELDTGAVVPGWSVSMTGSEIKDENGQSVLHKSGWARIYTNNSNPNGGITFILADKSKHIHYDNNGFFGMQIPDQYPAVNATTLTVEKGRLKPEYTFTGWNTQPDGSGVTINADDVLTLASLPTGVIWLGDTVINLYAQASYKGTYNVALSFINTADNKRYFLTHPNSSTPRFARARHFDEWTNTWQGMDGAENIDTNYVCTFELRHPINEINKKDGDIPDLTDREYVLDPRHYTTYGVVDSLTFYEFFAPSKDEYLGLYYADPNTILANNSWAGLFTTTSNATSTGWPDYREPCISSTKLKSERYVEAYDPDNLPDSLILKVRANSTRSFVKYVPATDQFDGVATEGEATDFQISAVIVADERYVVLPDTTKAWRDEIEFGYHQNAQTREEVWSALIGKQLMACMLVGGDTIYFHPNRNKIISDPNNLYLSSDFRITQTFDFIPDSRVSGVSETNLASSEGTSNYWCYNIVSGVSSPMNVKDAGGNYIDIVDTFRITLSQGGISKVKAYYGRWKKQGNDDGLTVNGLSRSRDIIVRTKTYHYSPEVPHLELTPEYSTYNFSPLAGYSKQLNFTLTKVTTRQLLDVNDNPIGKPEVVSTQDVTSYLALGPGACSFTVDSIFNVDRDNTVGNHVTLITDHNNNTPGHNYDTLVINKTIRIDEVDYLATARVPLTQPSLEGNELIWSVVDNNNVRYFIMAGNNGETNKLIYRRYSLKNNYLYQLNTSTQLIKGSANAANSDTKYITPWQFTYADQEHTQLTLSIEAPVSLNFVVESETTPNASTASPTALTYEYVNVYVNDNANFEEQVKIRYGDPKTGKWLKFSAENGLTLTSNYAEASVFSWSYLKRDYYLLNNGKYPNKPYLEFTYNNMVGASVDTKYQGYSEHSMLLGNKITYCIKKTQNQVSWLIAKDGDWRTAYSINLISDSRFANNASGLRLDTLPNNLSIKVTPTTPSPTSSGNDYKIAGKFENIVDTLDVQISLQDDAPEYRFKEAWKDFKSVEDAHLKIPLIRRTYHIEPYDSLICTVENDAYNHTFPALLTGVEEDSYTFVLHTEHRAGTRVLNVYNEVASSTGTSHDHTSDMDFTSKALTEIRLIDEYGNTPTWCRISGKTKNTITVECTADGIRSPRTASIYIAYTMKDDNEVWRYINLRLTVSQPSFFQYANNQHLVHSTGASGDPLDAKGMQQVHKNKRILYYYPEQDVELPIREPHFFGWWRWFREGEGEIGDSDIPDGDWRTMPRNVGTYNYPFRRIGNKVPDPHGGEGDSILVTMGRYTVFHYKSSQYKDVKKNPPIQTVAVAPPITTYGVAEKPTITYAADISNYYDKLPLSLSDKNQVDTAMLDTMRAIPEPTLSLREVFELRPWTEMADTLQKYRHHDETSDGHESYSERYMEDHVVMAPVTNRLLLSTEQRYNYVNIQAGSHSESLLGYYMKDDHWEDGGWDNARKDTMIWCGGWDADCQWFTYTPKAGSYAPCNFTITKEDDFLSVPAKGALTPAQTADTVYYCLRSRSKSTTGTPGDNETTVDGKYWFNICRYMVIYHRAEKFGPKLEENGVALITDDEIEQNYEVLERLNFDYNKPGNSYTVYPHPLPWADASYGFTYPETPDLPHNRVHSQSDLPNMGEYGLINRIHYKDYWYDMEQHGGAANGYMIYCDGMSSSGQVAALSLQSQLCEGQKMYFSGYVGNPSHQTPEKARPNFLFSVQGSLNNTDWEDITSYMTGEIPASDKWYQILFPIDQRTSYNYFRVRVFNMSSDWDGNDFTIDDMCIYATKPPLIAYQANTTCKNEAENDSLTHVVLRVDYQGFNDDTYNGGDVIYSIQRIRNNTDTTYMRLVDGYFNEQIAEHQGSSTVDTIYGKVPMPIRTYDPVDRDSIFTNLGDLILKFEQTLEASQVPDSDVEIFRQGYIYETLDEVTRPVMYIIHSAKMASDEKYMVRMAGKLKELASSKCAVTSPLRVKNHMVLELNGEEKDRKEVDGMCANSTYDVSLRVKGSLLLDNSAPIDINGSCVNDWLLYGDTAHAASILRYGYSYRDIVTVIKDILRCEPEGEVQTNTNQFARNLSEVSRNEMIRVKNWKHLTLKDTEDDPYTILSHLVTGGFLTLYRSKLTITTTKDNTVAYVIFPIVGTGSDAMLHRNVEVCPTPVYISLRSNVGGDIPITVGGFNPNARPTDEPATILVTVNNANDEIVVPIDSIMKNVALSSVDFLSTNDPDYLEGVHKLSLVPDIVYNISASEAQEYYENGQNMILSPAPTNTYQMKPGYNYTFGLTMMTKAGSLTIDGTDCRVGTIPFVVSVVPDYLRWEPKSEDSKAWNNPDNWLGIDEHNVPIHGEAHYAPLSSSKVIIPAVSSSMPYPELPSSITSKDSVKQTGFEYNQCSDIRLLPGAALGNQKYLTYTNAVVDMGTPQKMWALRSAPVTGMLSGDLFMADNDITGRTPAWEVGEFDASGRNYKTGNASFWLSLYNQTIVQKGNNDNVEDTKYTAEAAWSPVTNGMTYSLPPAQGWAVYTNTKSKTDADIRLPKHDDIFYYYYKNGDKAYDQYEQNLQSLRDEYAGGAGKAGKLAFHPATDNQEYTLSNGAESKTFVFGNPALGYIDIWSFVAFNSLKPEIGYMDSKGHYHTVNRETAVATSDVITNEQRYLPPMHAMVISLSDEAAATKSTTVTLKTDHVITKVSVPDPSSAPRRAADNGLKKGIMTVTAVNPCSPRCTSRLLLGQGYHSDIIVGEDALLTTLNIDNYTNNTTPATPFNIYAAEGEYGLCIDLRDEIVEIPLSFSMSDLPYDSITNLWFTGVNNISGSLVLFDSLTMSERPIIDGICLKIETPEFSHEKRYYIRRHGDLPIDPVDPPIATDYQTYGIDEILPVYKFIKDGHVYILRDGHVYTIFGQKIR